MLVNSILDVYLLLMKRDYLTLFQVPKIGYLGNEREKERGREIDRQTDRQKGRERGREGERQSREGGR